MPRVWLFMVLCVSFPACSRAPQSKPAEAAKAEAPNYFHVDPATAGAITGRVRFHGRPPAAEPIDMDEDAECAKLHGGKRVPDEAVIVSRNRGLDNVFIYVKSGLEGKHFPPPSGPMTIDQKGCLFHPRVLGMQAGQMLQVTNSDPVTHNIHPMPRVNREWNHSQSAGDPPMERRFTRPEVMIRVKCNIHHWMRSSIAVLDHPYFAVTGADGSFEISNVPPGHYTLEAWQEKLGAQTQEIDVGPSGKVSVAFTFPGERS